MKTVIIGGAIIGGVVGLLGGVEGVFGLLVGMIWTIYLFYKNR